MHPSLRMHEVSDVKEGRGFIRADGVYSFREVLAWT